MSIISIIRLQMDRCYEQGQSGGDVTKGGAYSTTILQANIVAMSCMMIHNI